MTDVSSLYPGLTHSSLFQLQLSASQAERLRIFESLRDRQVQVTGDTSGQDLTIRLADGRTLNGSAGVTAPLQIAQNER